VRVLEVDLARKRISLTMRLDAPVQPKGAARADHSFRPAARGERPAAPQPATQGALAAAFAKLKSKA
jgi:uncharacterized protein